jgi:hypothetical protein
VTRHATAQDCVTCGAAVLVGVDADTAGVPVTVDRQPVDRVGEVLAIISGRRTYELCRTGSGQRSRRVLEPRPPSRIRDDALRLHTVHAEHRCGQPLPVAPVTATPTTWPEGAF